MAGLKREASDLELVDATVRRLGSVLDGKENFYALTSESPCLQDQARLLHINDADKQVLKIPTYVDSLRAPQLRPLHGFRTRLYAMVQQQSFRRIYSLHWILNAARGVDVG